MKVPDTESDWTYAKQIEENDRAIREERDSQWFDLGAGETGA